VTSRGFWSFAKRFFWGGDVGYPPISWFVGVVMFVPVGIFALVEGPVLVGVFLLAMAVLCWRKTLERMRD
jgi:hypothetical protein